MGGALAQHGAWRWLFFLNIPVCAIALCLNCIFLRSSKPQDGRRLSEKLARMDLMCSNFSTSSVMPILTYLLRSGSTIMTGSTVFVFLAITWGGLRYPWDSPSVLILLVVGIFGMLSFFVVERYWLKGPTVCHPTVNFTKKQALML